jgi:phenylpropionate dioxygenase-like ring-hydroxylating dioxygenase large terminal subunit
VELDFFFTLRADDEESKQVIESLVAELGAKYHGVFSHSSWVGTYPLSYSVSAIADVDVNDPDEGEKALRAEIGRMVRQHDPAGILEWPPPDFAAIEPNLPPELLTRVEEP